MHSHLADTEKRDRGKLLLAFDNTVPKISEEGHKKHEDLLKSMYRVWDSGRAEEQKRYEEAEAGEHLAFLSSLATSPVIYSEAKLILKISYRIF